MGQSTPPSSPKVEERLNLPLNSISSSNQMAFHEVRLFVPHLWAALDMVRLDSKNGVKKVAWVAVDAA